MFVLYAGLMRVGVDSKKVRAGGHTSKIFDRLINSCSTRVAYMFLEQRALLIKPSRDFDTARATLRGKRGRWRGAFGSQSHRIGCTMAPCNERASRPLL